MFWALNGSQKVEPTPAAKALCPCCGTEVLAKCGSINQWHWAHVISDCDQWSEPESEWHRGWKACFPEEWQEVVVGNHRADVKTPNLIIEFQASAISESEIEARESHYKKMIWVLRGEDFDENFIVRRKKDFETFRWKHPRKSWWAARCPILIDLGDQMFNVKKIYQNVPCGGWGRAMSKIEFLTRCKAPTEFIKKFQASEKDKMEFRGCQHVIVRSTPRDRLCVDCGEIFAGH